MLLYDSPVSGNCYKVRLLLAHLGIPFERRKVDVVDRSTRPELLGALNPALRVPTLVLDDGRPLAESGAILWYFGEGTPFVPDDRYARAQVLQWMFFEQYEHEPALAVVRFWVAYSGRPEAFADRLDERMRAGHRALAAMDRHLDGREWCAGDRAPTWTREAPLWRVRRRVGRAAGRQPGLAAPVRVHRVDVAVAGPRA